MKTFTDNNEDFTADIIKIKSDIQNNKHLTIERFSSLERHRDSVKRKIKDLKFRAYIKDNQIKELYQLVERLLKANGETLYSTVWVDNTPPEQTTPVVGPFPFEVK